MLLSYDELQQLISDGVITADRELVNGASIDVCLDPTIMVEREPREKESAFIDLQAKQSLKMIKLFVQREYYLQPGQFILASTTELFNLPDNIACEFKLKSSLARAGLNNMLATWCDPSWSNSKLTLELKNDTQFHTLIIRPGMKIGQMVFYRVKPVPHEHSYAVKGRYNNTTEVTESKGV
jgi:dCTP deaminase